MQKFGNLGLAAADYNAGRPRRELARRAGDFAARDPPSMFYCDRDCGRRMAGAVANRSRTRVPMLQQARLATRSPLHFALTIGGREDVAMAVIMGALGRAACRQFFEIVGAAAFERPGTVTPGGRRHRADDYRATIAQAAARRRFYQIRLPAENGRSLRCYAIASRRSAGLRRDAELSAALTFASLYRTGRRRC